MSIGDVVTRTVEVAELDSGRPQGRLICEASVDGRTVLDGEAVVVGAGPPGRAGGLSVTGQWFHPGPGARLTGAALSWPRR